MSRRFGSESFASPEPRRFRFADGTLWLAETFVTSGELVLGDIV